MQRVVTAETLDHLPPDDPAAMRSRRDLGRVHLAMGTRAQVCAGWRALVSARRTREPLRILELGAGDGRLLLGVARRLAPSWPSVRLTLLDRQRIVAPATVAAYAALGWTVRLRTADATAWAADGTRDDAAPRWDLVSTSLFLHHFDDAPLARLLAAVARRCDRFFAIEPARSRLALAGSHLVGLLGANAVTREDAVLSVRAGFRGRELSALWPREDPGGGGGGGGGAGAWRLHEAPAGPFGHALRAHRPGADA